MEKQEEFEIIKIQKDLEKESKEAIVKSTLLEITSPICMTAGLILAYKNNMSQAIGMGTLSVLTGMLSGIELEKSFNIKEKIKSLKK